MGMIPSQSSLYESTVSSYSFVSTTINYLNMKQTFKCEWSDDDEVSSVHLFPSQLWVNWSAAGFLNRPSTDLWHRYGNNQTIQQQKIFFFFFENKNSKNHCPCDHNQCLETATRISCTTWAHYKINAGDKTTSWDSVLF